MIESVSWASDGAAVRIIDQRHLPAELVERELRSIDEVVEAIRTLSVRGAPAIGVAAAMGLAAAARTLASGSHDEFVRGIQRWGEALRNARPTAVNLAWAVDRVLAKALGEAGVGRAIELMLAEADAIREEDRSMCRRIGEHGATLLHDGMNVLTHCNTGALATAGIGTALAAIYVAHESGRKLRVFASETRPLLQGSRLTAWELSRAGIDVTVVGEGAVATLMRTGEIDCCITGADRITRCGDVANKIGTYSHAALANCHGIPFYVAAPWSTVDAATECGDDVKIESRHGGEILSAAGYTADPVHITAYNPAFDITPAQLITAIVTDAGVHAPPYDFATR